MHVDEVPRELAVLEKLEQILIAQRIVFEKIVIMPKGEQRKIKGAVCNVPVECDETCAVLPRPSERSGIIMLKLKRKLEFKGHAYNFFEEFCYQNCSSIRKSITLMFMSSSRSKFTLL